MLRCTTGELFFSCFDSVAAHFKHAATRQPGRKQTVETCVDTTAKLRPQATVLAFKSASTTPRSYGRRHRLTSSMLPHVSLGASQLLIPASTPPRSYGRRHRSWHYEPQAQTNCSNLRRQHREATAAGIGPGTTAMYMQRTTSGAAGNGLFTTIKYMRGASGICMALQSSSCDAQQAAPRETAWAQRSSTCGAQRAPPRTVA